MKLRSIFHKPEGEHGIGKWIVVWTWFLALFYDHKALKYNYSHEELWIPDENGAFRHIVNSPFKPPRQYYVGQCFSSTTRGDSKGVRFAPASEVLKHPERWEYIEFEVNEALYADILIFMEMHAKWKTKYDFAGIMGFVVPFAPQDDDRWYCSELCNYIKAELNVIDDYSEPISPRRSAMILAEDWGEPKPI